MQRSVSMGPMSLRAGKYLRYSFQAGGQKSPSERQLGLVVSWIDGEKGIQAETIHSIQLEKKKTSIKFKIYFFSLNHFFFLTILQGIPQERDPWPAPVSYCHSPSELGTVWGGADSPRTLIPLSYKVVG